MANGLVFGVFIAQFGALFGRFETKQSLIIKRMRFIKNFFFLLNSKFAFCFSHMQ